MSRTNGLILKVTLDSTKPPIWRRVAIPADFTLDQLHIVIQMAMGWFDCHLHCFRAGQRTFGPTEDQEFDLFFEDEAKVRVTTLLPRKGSKIKYEYDFGDDWRHTILCEGTAPEPVSVPRVLKGRRACPPEDCGGVYGFYQLLERLKGAPPQNEWDKEQLEWLGDYDPEAFDLEDSDASVQGAFD